jgi:S1-C subfamily serine protease
MQVRLGSNMIIAIDNNALRKIDDIIDYVEREKLAGDRLKLTILRGGQTMEVIAILGSRPSQQESP